MSIYKHFNPNPKGLELGDCSIRCLCAVTDLSWYEIFDILTKFARDNCIVLNETETKYVEEKFKLFGFVRRKFPKLSKGEKAYTVKDFCRIFPKGKYVLKLASHSMGVVDGKYYDIYNCWDNARVYSYYVKE